MIEREGSGRLMEEAKGCKREDCAVGEHMSVRVTDITFATITKQTRVRAVK